MTGGQMAPTTLNNMVTSTSPEGRNVETMGGPLKILDMLALLDGVCLATRVSVHTAAAVKKRPGVWLNWLLKIPWQEKVPP